MPKSSPPPLSIHVDIAPKLDIFCLLGRLSHFPFSFIDYLLSQELVAAQCMSYFVSLLVSSVQPTFIMCKPRIGIVAETVPCSPLFRMYPVCALHNGDNYFLKHSFLMLSQLFLIFEEKIGFLALSNKDGKKLISMHKRSIRRLSERWISWLYCLYHGRIFRKGKLTNRVNRACFFDCVCLK